MIHVLPSSKTGNESTPSLTRPQADQDSYTSTVDIARLWVHECERVFRDRIISSGEMASMDAMMAETAKKYLTEFQVIRDLNPFSTPKMVSA